MSVVGVDFGTLNTAIAVARNRGVDVVRTDPSSTENSIPEALQFLLAVATLLQVDVLTVSLSDHQ
jgi:molecular chaperone DnaK (HSP70)